MILNRKFLKFEIDLDFVLIAITTPLKDYRICYVVNKSLNFNFTRIPDLAVDFQQNGSLAFFSFYSFYPEDTKNEFYFIANKGTEGHLIPELRSADYFLLIKNHVAETEADALVYSLNKLTEIVAAVKIDPKKIKSRENLLF